MRTYYILLLFVFTIVANISYSQEQLKLELIMDKTEFQKGELVHCGVQLTNTGTTEVIVNHAGPLSGLRIQLFDKNNANVEYNGPLFSVAGMTRIKIEPGDSTFDMYSLNDMYGERFSMATTHKYLNVGSYLIRITYTSGNGTELQKESKFDVVEPQGDEAKAYNLFISTFSDMGNHTITIKEGIERLRTLEINYPNSIYTPIALSKLASIYKIVLKNKQKANEIYIRIVEKYPDGKKIPGMLNAALRSTSDPVEKEKFLNRIEEKTEDRMGKLCIKKIREPNIIMNQAK